MKKEAAQSKEFAKKLVAIALDESGRVSAERVGDILEALRQDPPRQHRAVLKQFLVYLRRELAKSQARVEYAGDITETALKEIEENLSKHYDRKVDVVTWENPDLIAGFRVSIGDDVYDSSIAGRLHSLELATS